MVDDLSRLRHGVARVGQLAGPLCVVRLNSFPHRQPSQPNWLHEVKMVEMMNKEKI